MIDLIGFKNNSEFLPKDFDTFDSKQKLRQLFLYMSNIILKDFCHFNKYEQNFLSNYSLKQAFTYKIKKDLNMNYVLSHKKNSFKFNLCKNSTKIINNYINNTNSSFISKNCKLKVAKLISSCFVNKELQLLIDKHLVFHEFVLKKLKKLHSDKTIIDLGNAICIKSDEFHGIKIYTSWKDIKINKPDIKDELESAIKAIKKGESYQIYLAYPKNSDFTKQIPIYVNELENHEYQIKAIPYSLRSIIKTNRSL